MSQAGINPQSAVDGRYLLDAPLDRWGAGESWQARDKNFRNRPVVLEFFAPDRADVALERSPEIRAQRTLKHPCVGPVINQGNFEGRPWVAFDGFEGVSLARFIDDERRARAQVDRATAEGLFDKVLDGVCAAHEAPVAVLHGCLSARSVVVKQGALKVIDFGLGPLASPDTLGPYRAPELSRLNEPPSLASDVYSLGVLLCDLVMPQNVGDARRALEALVAALVRDGAQAGRMQRQDLPPAAWEVIARAVRRDPSTRWEDVSAMRKALTAAWATAPAPAPSTSPVLAPAPPAPRPATLAMPPAGSPLRAPTAAMPAPSQPFAAPFTGPMPPVQPAMPAQPAFTAPAFTAPAFTAPPAPAAPPAWNAPPPPAPPVANASDAWATLKPAGHAQARAALASSWDAAAPSPPGPPPASLASSWDAGEANPHWGAPPSYAPPLPAPPHHAPQVPIASHPSVDDDDWEDETRASAEHPLRAAAPHAIAPSGPSKALQNKLSEMARQESTMALDIDSLNLGGVGPSPARAPSGAGDDWKEGVVLLDTAPARDLEESDDEPYEPGSRTHVTPTPAPVLDSMETLRPMQRPVAIEAFVPRPVGNGPVDSESTFVASSPLVPEVTARPLTMAPLTPQPVTAPLVPLPPVSERTMALDLSGGPESIVQTMPAPMGLHGPLPIAPRPPAAPAPAPPSKAPILVAVVIALLLIAGALVVVFTRK